VLAPRKLCSNNMILNLGNHVCLKIFSDGRHCCGLTYLAFEKSLHICRYHFQNYDFASDFVKKIPARPSKIILFFFNKHFKFNSFAILAEPLDLFLHNYL
jgi:hypothetical protein